NQYFFNGFNITNTFQNLNFVQVPFEGIAEQQVKTGGYGAEFGRSTGGVINQISKRGSNEFHAGGNVFWSPEGLNETPPNRYSNTGTLLADNSQENDYALRAAVWASGALVKDTLFLYGLYEYGHTGARLDPINAGSSQQIKSDEPKWLLKADWNLNDSNIIEFTALSDRREFDTSYYKVANNAVSHLRGAFMGTEYSNFGGDSYILKYTGYLTDTFTLSVLAGTGESARENWSVSANGERNEYFGNVGGPVSGCPIIIDARPSVNAGLATGRSGCELAQILGRPDASDSRDQFRIDAEWQLGDHLLRGGVDIDNYESIAGESYSGGMLWRYGRYLGREDIVRKRVFQSGATVQVDQTAFYIEDSWNITDDFVAYLGLRWDTFDNKNGLGESYVKIDNQFAPRLGFSWDVFGDSSFKVFANAGRYALPLTGNVAVRGASASLFSEQFYTYTGVDPDTGAPTGIVLIPNPNTPGRDIRYLNNEFGIGKDPRTIASQNLEPMYQDEYIVGFQKELNDTFSLGVRGIYRDLKRAIDDQCDYRPIIEWALANGFTDNGSGGFQTPADKTLDTDIAVYNAGFPFCRLYNPGEDGLFTMDVNGDGVFETIPIAADVLGPEAKRKYSALEFFWQGNWDKVFVQGSYTYARSIGNTEGGVKSDIGQDDTGTTQDFDYPELAIGSYGYLPNDRRHSVKVFGNYEITDQWSTGANLRVQSGRPINCFGFLGGSNTSHYGNSYFSCDPGPTTNDDGTPTHPGDGSGNNGTTVVPRGTAGRLPWSTTLDLNVAYKPSWAEGLQFKIDVFNVFNSREAITVNEFGEDTAGNPQPEIYKIATNWQDPRAVRFMVQYDF
ncbi:MAG: TonB-dependent receptor, partial [Lysobacter sp.]|nr:TonB-dependent receptor [Lysobacter sp.]